MLSHAARGELPFLNTLSINFIENYFWIAVLVWYLGPNSTF